MCIRIMRPHHWKWQGIYTHEDVHDNPCKGYKLIGHFKIVGVNIDAIESITSQECIHW
jgi:hypothetical protein